VRGDAYAREWVAQAWAKTGIRYEKAELNASMLYLEALPSWTRGLVEIPDHPALVRELHLLERIPGRIGKDQVTHPRNVHDDLANAVCGALAMLALAQSNEWMRPENMRRITEQCAIRPPYRRPLGPDERAASGVQILGERRWLQMQKAKEMRRWR
jgi:hypothetical protein